VYYLVRVESESGDFRASRLVISFIDRIAKQELRLTLARIVFNSRGGRANDDFLIAGFHDDSCPPLDAGLPPNALRDGNQSIAAHRAGNCRRHAKCPLFTATPRLSFNQL